MTFPMAKFRLIEDKQGFSVAKLCSYFCKNLDWQSDESDP